MMISSWYSYAFGIIAALAVTIFIIELLRRGILKEKFAFLWLGVSLIALVLAVFPGLIGVVANRLGVQVPVNLLFFVTAVLLLLVSVQLSYEISRIEARTRRLAEEVAILQEKVDRLSPDEQRGSQISDT